MQALETRHDRSVGVIPIREFAMTCHAQSQSQNLRSPWSAVKTRETLGETISSMRIDADCAVKTVGQNSVISFFISKWLVPESLGFFERWSRGTKTPGTLVPCHSCNKDALSCACAHLVVLNKTSKHKPNGSKIQPTYATKQEGPASRGSRVQSMSFHRGARDSNTLSK